MSARLSGRAKGTTVTVFVTVNRHEEVSDRSAPYADFAVMDRSWDRSSKPFQELEVFRGLQSLRRSLSSKPFNIHKHHRVASMCILKGVKRFQAVRPRACKKPPALDRRPHGVILGYARLPLIKLRNKPATRFVTPNRFQTSLQTQLCGVEWSQSRRARWSLHAL